MQAHRSERTGARCLRICSVVMICKKSAGVLDGGCDGCNKDTWRKGNERDSCGISEVVMGERSLSGAGRR